jgi:predicted glycosyltransferase
MVPFGTGRQAKQMRRAQALSRLGWVETVPDGAINGDHLAAALNAAVAKGSAQGREAPEIDLSGAKTTSRLVGRWLTKGEVLRCEALSSPA